jgi:hypothetical protein
LNYGKVSPNGNCISAGEVWRSICKGTVAMAKSKKQWIRTKAKPSKVPDALIRELSAKANALIEDRIRPEHVKPPPKNPSFNYIENVFTKCRGRYFYFMAKYASPEPNSISPSFEVGFARLEFIGDDQFDLAYFRHTGKWWRIFSELTVDEALNFVGDGGHFTP